MNPVLLGGPRPAAPRSHERFLIWKVFLSRLKNLLDKMKTSPEDPVWGPSGPHLGRLASRTGPHEGPESEPESAETPCVISVLAYFVRFGVTARRAEVTGLQE